MDAADPRDVLAEVERLFEAASPDFLDSLRQLTDAALVARLADRWARDRRDWARLQLLAYLEGPLDTDGHQPLIKRLYRRAESNRDLEVVAAFLVAFDRLVTHVRRGEESGAPRLSALKNAIPSFRRKRARDDGWHDHRRKAPLPHRARLFSYRTRYYLRRRAWRFLRQTARQQPRQYPAAAAAVLLRYTDHDLQSGEAVLDRWGLMQIAFRQHPILSFGANRVQLRPNRRLAVLTPAPSFRPLWQTPAAADGLLRLAVDARSHLVRRWAVQLLHELHASWLRSLSPLTWLPLLEHPLPAIRELALELLQASDSLRSLPIDECLPLAETSHPAARRFAVNLIADRAQGSNLPASEAVALACSRSFLLAGLGWQSLRDRHAIAPLDTDTLASLANARCHRLAGPLATWALELAGDRATPTALGFFRGNLPPMRRAACAWWQQHAASEVNAEPWTGLWSELCAVPHRDVQASLVRWLGRQLGDSSLGSTRDLPPHWASGAARLWQAVLSSPATSARTLHRACDQVATASHSDPQLGARLLPLLATQLQQGRGSARQAALAAMVRLAAVNNGLRQAVLAQLPELDLEPATAAI